MKPFRYVLTLTMLALASISSFGAVQDETIRYEMTIDSANLCCVTVQMKFNASGHLRVAMAAHPEYDDRYFRYVEHVYASSSTGELKVTREQDPVWKIDAKPGPVTFQYRLRFPPQENGWRDAWKPYLTKTGGMVGDLHTLMYVVGRERAPARLSFTMPPGWHSAAGLSSAAPRSLEGTVDLLLDAPIMVGEFTTYNFTAGGVPHKVVIWSPPDAKPFDQKGIADNIKKLVDETIRAFGPPPYPQYAFLIQNGGSAALEHRTSLNVGYAPDRDPAEFFEEIAHEYVHTWNLIDVRPKERVGVSYEFAPPTEVLWWSEGATIFFADLLLRRAGLPTTHKDRRERLKSLLGRYFAAPGYSRLSGAIVSRGDTDPSVLGNDFASPHLQGEVFSIVLDLMIRDKTRGQRDLTDVQKLLSSRFDIDRGIDNRDIEKAIADTCGCEVRPFFRDHIESARPLDLKTYLAMIGLDVAVTRTTAVGNDGKPVVDLRIGPLGGEGPLRLRILNSESVWARAGLRTGDQVVTVDRKPVADWNGLRSWLRSLKVGDTGRFEVLRNEQRQAIDVRIEKYDATHVRLNDRRKLTPAQRRLRTAWFAAN